jgi:hypothetical protein
MQKPYDELKTVKEYPTPAGITKMTDGSYVLTVIATERQLRDLRHPMREWRARRAESFHSMYASIEEANQAGVRLGLRTLDGSGRKAPTMRGSGVMNIREHCAPSTSSPTPSWSWLVLSPPTRTRALG